MTTQDPQRSDARRLARSLRETSTSPQRAKQDTTPGHGPADRRMLWVDAVGGFLVCLDDEIVLGQPGGSAAPQASILADISRRHAVLRRDQGAYVLEPIAPTKLNGKAISGPTLLGDDCQIELGESVRVQFTRPHALSATARLKITSGHRTLPAADALLLMAESCVLGAGRHSHVFCKNWQEDVILFRHGEQLLCRSASSLTVDGVTKDGAQRIYDGTRIEGQDFAIGIEVV